MPRKRASAGEYVLLAGVVVVVVVASVTLLGGSVPVIVGDMLQTLGVA